MTLPNDLTSPYPLDSSTLVEFDKQGFVKMRNVLSPETVESYEPEITRRVIELNTQHLPLAERDTYGKAFLQVTNLWQHSEQVKELVTAPRLAQIAADLLGLRRVRLYHDQALYKEPGGGITPWHADQYYWPFSTDRCVTVWIPLQPTPMEMGPLGFAAGSHGFEFGRDLAIGDESEQLLQQELARQHFPEVATPYELGEVSYHLGWTFHRASPNRGKFPRRVMTIIYVDADMVVTERPNEPQQMDLQTWLPGVGPGEVAASPLNPVLYP